MKKNKNICFSNSLKFWGGGEKSYYKFGKLLSERGYTVHYLLPKDGELYKRLEKEEWAILATAKARHNSWFNPIQFIQAFIYLKKNKISKIFVNRAKDWKFLGIASKILGIKKVIFSLGVPAPIGDSFTRRFFFNNIITDIIVKSKESVQVLMDNDYKLVNGKVTCIYNGIDVEEFDEIETEILYERKDEEVILGYSGRLEDIKGVEYLIKACSILKEKGKNFKLLIAGTGSLEEKLKKMVKELNLEKEIEFLGFLKNIKSLLKNIDIFTFPSLSEGFPNSVIEAMTSRLPSVVFDISSLPELVVHKETGFCSEAKSYEDFAKNLLTLLENKELREKMGDSARVLIEKKYTIENVIEQYIKVIEA